MPVNDELTHLIWDRFNSVRDNGHDKFTAKADRCEAYFAGDQWSAADRAVLEAVRRPAMTINKILPTVSTVLGEQIFNRTEIGYVPRGNATEDVATALTKVFKQISDNNQLDYVRSSVFEDGVITSRGYFDCRIDYNDSMQGEVRITSLNPKNVIPDPDAEEYDPDTWGDVTTTKWITADDVAVLYSKKDADILRYKEPGMYDYTSYDALDYNRNRFGEVMNPSLQSSDQTNVLRNIRQIERQYRKLDRQKHFVERTTGDTRQIPDHFDRDMIALFTEKYGFGVIDKLVRRIRWTVIAANVVLFDEWSPYNHFTVVPYFPIFRRGRTIGVVENLLGPQDVLNKVTSQELHVVNTTANSGYKVKAGALQNMTPAELEAKGAQTGIVIEVDDIANIERITPNQVPQGLDRISFKAEESIKTISGVNDSMQGFDREDVAAKAIDKKAQKGSQGLAKMVDNLARTDWLLARNTLDLIQNFYTEERIIYITKDSSTGEQEQIAINQKNAAGQIVNDLTLGEYGVVVTSVPHRESLMDSEFEQALSLRQLGVAIPDTTLVMTSRIRNKMELIKQMTGDADSPEGQRKAALAARGEEAGVAKLEGEAAQKAADAELKKAKAQEVLTPEPEQGDGGAAVAKVDTERKKAGAEIDMQDRELQHKMQMDVLEQQRKDDELRLQAQDMAQKRADARAQQAQQAAAAALAPQKQQTK